MPGPLAARVMHLSNELEIHSRLGGEAATIAMVRQRSVSAHSRTILLRHAHRCHADRGQVSFGENFGARGWSLAEAQECIS
jgi:hypothetical protein